jgi:DNA-binding phage protein
MSRSRNYETRIDRFRARERIDLARWADLAGISRTQLGKYRSGRSQPRSTTIAVLVRAASSILGRPVRAVELYDLGEDEALGPVPEAPRFTRRRDYGKRFPTRFDSLLWRLGVSPNGLARKAGLARQQLWLIRAQSSPGVETIRRIVVTLRRMGFPVRADDVVDVGED